MSGAEAGAALSPPVILFGLGATKAGTSWLYRYLAGHPDCHLRTVKELHYFDAETPEGLRFQLRQLRARRDKLRDARDVQPRGLTEWRKLDAQLRDVSDLLALQKSRGEGEYLHYLTEGRGNRPLVADITPAYALLPPERLTAMAALADSTRFVYLMRDPVARLWSHVRMMAARRLAGRKDADLVAEAGQVLDEALAGRARHITDRGDYGAALARFDAALPEGRLFIGFFEELFGAETIARLCAFLGIAPTEGRYERKVHEGVRVEMTDAQRQRAAVALRPQYDMVAARMGRLPPAWAANMAGEAG